MFSAPKALRWVLGSILLVGALFSLPLEATAPWEQANYRALSGFSPEDPQAWYQQQLRWAFRKLIPDSEERDPVERLMKALEDPAQNRTIILQILEAHRALSLRDFILELKGQIDKKRAVLSETEEDFLRGQASFPERDETRRSVKNKRLTPSEAAVVLHFYLSRSHESFIPRATIHYSKTSTGRSFAEVIQWPPISLREHGENQELAELDSKKWRAVAAPFWYLNLKNEFFYIWTQLGNQTAGHLRYRHIEGFESRLLLEIREIALRGQFSLARDLLLNYLVNYNSSVLISRYTRNLERWPTEKRDTLAYRIVQLSALVDKRVLRAFFERGILPRGFSEISSKQWNNAVTTFQTAGKLKTREACLRKLAELDRAQRVKNTTRSKDRPN